MQNRQAALRVRIIEAERRNDPIALALFAVACIGILVLVLAPKGTFVTQTGIAQVER